MLCLVWLAFACALMQYFGNHSKGIAQLARVHCTLCVFSWCLRVVGVGFSKGFCVLCFFQLGLFVSFDLFGALGNGLSFYQ